MENTINFVILASQYLGIDPKGIITGLIGATFSVLVLNRNKFSVSKVILIIFSGAVLSGYGIHIFEEYLPKNPKGTAIASLLSVVTGFISSDILSSIKTAAPTFTNSVIKVLTNILLKFVSTKNGVDVTPNDSKQPSDSNTNSGRGMADNSNGESR
jgi:hypothetical membrane protein